MKPMKYNCRNVSDCLVNLLVHVCYKMLLHYVQRKTIIAAPDSAVNKSGSRDEVYFWHSTRLVTFVKKKKYLINSHQNHCNKTNCAH